MSKRIAIVYLLCLLHPYYTNAIDYQEYLLLHNSHHCSNYFDHFEQKNQIPQHLLRSISIVETGRWHSGAQIYLPWPWAVNQGGKSHYFSTKKEAIKKVKQMLELGLTNIDIGCMQINLHHHPEAFLNLNQAFEPKDNIEYAANFLIKNYQQSQNWQKAIASYHSKAPVGQTYATKVLKIWSEYKDNKLHHSHCTSNNGSIIACKNATTNNNISQSVGKEKLPLAQLNDTNNTKKLSKDLKRLKSAMISYSINNESQ